MIFGRSADIPLHKDPAARTLPWIIAVMAFLAVLSMAGAFALGTMIARWSSTLTGTMTVQVPAAATADETQARLVRVEAILKQTRGIARYRVLSAAESAALVEPWLGRDVGKLGLPLPRLIDVGLAPGEKIDLPELRQRLERAAAGTQVEDHQKWLDELVGLIRWAWALALAVVLLVILASALTVVFATRTSLRIHRAVTEVLHLIGARDEYVAGQFQSHALAMGLKGGAIGAILAAAAVIGMERLLARVEALKMMKVGLTPLQWAILALVPIGAAALAALVARYTVLRGLARMP
jgi:cell division transport system permease protein